MPPGTTQLQLITIIIILGQDDQVIKETRNEWNGRRLGTVYLFIQLKMYDTFGEKEIEVFWKKNYYYEMWLFVLETYN